MENAFSAARLWTAIDALPDRCREVFLMAKRDGMTYREIAEELGISERTVEHQVSKALHLLRQQKSVFFRLLLFL
jgi:RNA polymerase sigma-70 factor (ECF subfamily)